MRNPDDSWWLKLKRAKKHLAELEEYTAALTEVHPYETQLTINREVNHTDYIVRAFLQTPLIDFTPAIIIGDVIHNARSALDHVIAALTEPPELREHSSFPIYEEDIWRPGFKAQRKTSNTATEGLPEPARAFVKDIQPYRRGKDAIRDPLALLNRFSNADKHRELIVTTRSLLEPGTGLRWEPDGPVLVQHRVGKVFENGAVIAYFTTAGPPPDTEPHVHSHGAIQIAIQGSREYGGDFPLPDVLDDILKYVWEHVILTLDTFVPS
jgi:hypothetical protein